MVAPVVLINFLLVGFNFFSLIYQLIYLFFSSPVSTGGFSGISKVI